MAIVYPRTTHREAHFTGSATVRDVVIGMSDGLTVPFALAAGLSGAVNSSFVVLVAGVAEMAAGSVAMGLGGYLAARSEADSYRSELAREHAEVRDVPEVEAQEVRDIFRRYGLDGSALDSAVQAVRSSPEGWVRFMMREELGLEEPDPKRAPRRAVTIGLSYIAGGLLPLAPYALGLSLTTAFLSPEAGAEVLRDAVAPDASSRLAAWFVSRYVDVRPDAALTEFVAAARQHPVFELRESSRVVPPTAATPSTTRGHR